MKQLLNSVETLISEELERANKDNPLFNSRHEGIAVIEEEVWEAKKEFNAVEPILTTIKKDVYGICTDEYINERVKQLKEYATRSAAELIQVAAMCDKWEQSKAVRKEYSKRRRVIWCEDWESKEADND